MTTPTEPHHATHRPCPIACLIGPSGAGKSTLAARTAADLGLVHLEIDRYPPGDGIDLEGLRQVWDAFWLENDAHPLATTLRARAADANADGVVLSLPSGVVPHDEQVHALARENITSSCSTAPAPTAWTPSSGASRHRRRAVATEESPSCVS